VYSKDVASEQTGYTPVYSICLIVCLLERKEKNKVSELLTVLLCSATHLAAAAVTRPQKFVGAASLQDAS
jgi:hypothetical protein